MKKTDFSVKNEFTSSSNILGSKGKSPGKINLKNLADVESMKPNKKYVSFREAHAFARSLNLRDS